MYLYIYILYVHNLFKVLPKDSQFGLHNLLPTRARQTPKTV